MHQAQSPRSPAPRKPWQPTTRWAALAALLLACGGPPEKERDPVVFFPEPPSPPRIQFLRSVSLDEDIEPPRSGLDDILFGERTVHRGVVVPYGAAIHDGLVYVCDFKQGLIVTLDFPGRKLDFLRLEGRAALQKPLNLAFAEDGTLYVADQARGQVVVLAPKTFEYAQEFGPFKDGSRPTDVEVVGDKLYVADAEARLVRLLDRHSGEQLMTYGSGERGEPRPKSPTNVTVNEDGTVFTVDTVNCQVCVYAADGSFLRFLGGPGDTVGQFARPKGITHWDGKLFVVDAAFSNCQILSEEGAPYLFFGGPGWTAGMLDLPAGIWVGDEGKELFEDRYADGFEPEAIIILTSQLGPRRVNFYALGRSDEFDYPPDPEPVAFEPQGE